MNNLEEVDPVEAEKLISKLETDPLYFIEIFLERKLSDKQQEFIRETLIKKHVVAIWSRQTGKSTIIASYILWKLLYGKGKKINNEWMPEHIAIVAPIKDQIKNLYDKIRKLVDKNEFVASFLTKMNTEIIKAKNGNEAKFLSASPGSQIRGYTATVIVIDESQDITDNKYNADVLPFGATTNALVIEAGTPKTKNHFYSTIQSKEVSVIRQPWYECPFLSEDYVMRQKETSPEALWRQEYLCEFIEDGVVAFPSILFEPERKDGKFTGRWNLSDYEYITKVSEFSKSKAEDIHNIVKEGATFTFGLDLGKARDNAVLSIIRTDERPMKIYALVEFALGTNYSDIARQVSLFYKVFQPYEFNFDYTNEKSFIETLQENDISVNLDKKNVRGPIAFTNKNKAEMVNTGNILFENYQFQLPKLADKLISQFLNQQFELNEQGQKKFYHPSNEHDDALWSILLAIKNITVLQSKDFISFKNPWEKYDEKVHHSSKGNSREVMSVNLERRDRHRRHNYFSSDLRRDRLRS